MTAVETARQARTMGRINPLPMSRSGVAAALVAGAVVLGAILRVALADGDLWLDEIWSLMLVRGLPSPCAVFWGISHDNNHFLNSLWLYALGPDRPAWAYRAPAVVMGTLSIGLAARIGLRRGRTCGVAAALLAATALPLVVYGSEARGYAGLILATLLAVDCFEAGMAEPIGQGAGWRRRPALLMGAAVCFGTLSHLTMLATLAVLGLAALLRHRARGLAPRAALAATLSLFGPALLGPLPALAAVAAGILVRGTFTFGGYSPFEIHDFASGYGAQLRLMMGLPAALPLWSVFVAAALLLAAVLRVGRVDPLRRDLALSALVVLPAGMIVARLPTLEFPRYFLVPGLVLMLAQADLVGRLWNGGTASRRGAALILLGATLLGQVAADTSALRTGRGHYGDAMALMAGDGKTFTYASDDRYMAKAVIDVMAPWRGLAGRFVPPERLCADAPDWYVVVMEPGPEHPPSVTLGPAECAQRFDLRATFPTLPVSGMRWTLYRRAG